MVDLDEEAIKYYESLVDAYGELKYIIGGEDTTQFCFDFAVDGDVIVYQVVPYAEHFVEKALTYITPIERPPRDFIAEYLVPMSAFGGLTLDEHTKCVDTMRRWVRDIDAAIQQKATND